MVEGAFNDEKPQTDDDPILLNYFKRNALPLAEQRNSKTYVIFTGNKAIAYFTIGITNLTLPNTKRLSAVLVLGKLYVSTECRGKGIGEQIFDYLYALGYLADAVFGCRGIYIDSSLNPKTINFYTKNHCIKLPPVPEKNDTQPMYRNLD